MSMSLAAAAAQVCTFALGCVLIHAARTHAAAITHLLTRVAAVALTALLLVGSLHVAPDHEAPFDEVTVFAALSLQPAVIEAEPGANP